MFKRKSKESNFSVKHKRAKGLESEICNLKNQLFSIEKYPKSLCLCHETYAGVYTSVNKVYDLNVTQEIINTALQKLRGSLTTKEKELNHLMKGF